MPTTRMTLLPLLLAGLAGGEEEGGEGEGWGEVAGGGGTRGGRGGVGGGGGVGGPEGRQAGGWMDRR